MRSLARRILDPASKEVRAQMQPNSLPTRPPYLGDREGRPLN